MKRLLMTVVLVLSSQVYSRSITITSPIEGTVIPASSSTVTLRGEVDSVAGGAGTVICNGKTANFYSGVKWIRAIPINHEGAFTVNCSYSKDGTSASATISLVHEGQNNRPTPNFTSIILSGTNKVSFDASSSTDTDGTIVAYKWDFGDGTLAHGQIVEHTYSNPGTYFVDLTVVDNFGAFRKTRKPIIVSGTVVPESFSIRRKLNSELDVILDASLFVVSEQAPSFEWDFGDGQTQISTNPIIEHTYNDLGNYTISLTVKLGTQIVAESSLDYELLQLGDLSLNKTSYRTYELVFLQFSFNEVQAETYPAQIDNSTMSITRNSSNTAYFDPSNLSIGQHYLSVKIGTDEFVAHFTILPPETIQYPDLIVNNFILDYRNYFLNHPELPQTYIDNGTTKIDAFEQEYQNFTSEQKIEIARLIMIFPTLSSAQLNKASKMQDFFETEIASFSGNLWYGPVFAASGAAIAAGTKGWFRAIGGAIFVAGIAKIFSDILSLTAKVSDVRILKDFTGSMSITTPWQFNSGVRYSRNVYGIYENLHSVYGISLSKNDIIRKIQILVREMSDAVQTYTLPITSYSFDVPEINQTAQIMPSAMTFSIQSGQMYVNVIPPFFNGDKTELEVSCSIATGFGFYLNYKGPAEGTKFRSWAGECSP